VGIRLRNDRGEIPYEVSAGFNPEFLESESRLQLGRDECACTRMITGRPLPCDAPAMTPGGSFFCNDTFAFVSGLTEEEKRSFRGVCVKSGFASVAVVPIRYRETVLGVIHLADEGVGIDLGAADRRKGSPTGLGLFGIHERIAHLGGRMAVESAPGQGTRVILLAEVRPPAAGAAEQSPGENSAEPAR
jgi:hypothetical protein